ncbi:FkbM family methyltransferase [Mycolicibacterium elephantis]
MRIAARNSTTVLKALFEPRHYIAAFNMFRVYDHPFEMYRRYLSTYGTYPCTVELATPLGSIDITLYTHHDVLTVNEIFCRNDYAADANDHIVVDFGSNIGISAAYFLSRGPAAYTYLFEPLPSNIARLTHNLNEFVGRYHLEQVAVGTKNGTVQFGWEPTGRYGGVGQATGDYIAVSCRRTRDILEEVISRHGQIDVLKIDIETMEEAVISDIPCALASKIRKVYVEHRFRNNPLVKTHSLQQRGPIAIFTLR